MKIINKKKINRLWINQFKIFYKEIIKKILHSINKYKKDKFYPCVCKLA